MRDFTPGQPTFDRSDPPISRIAQPIEHQVVGINRRFHVFFVSNFVSHKDIARFSRTGFMATLGQLGLLALITHPCVVEDRRSSNIEANRGCKSSSSSTCSASYSSSSSYSSIQQPRRAAAAIRTRKVNRETSLFTSKGPHSRRRRSSVVVRAGGRRMEVGAAAESGDSQDKFMYSRNAGNEVRQFEEEDLNGTYVVGIDRRYGQSRNGKDEYLYESGTPRRILADESLIGPPSSNQDGQQWRQRGLSDTTDATEILTLTLGLDGESSGNADGDDYIGRDRQYTGEYRGGRQWQRRSETEADFDQDTGPDVRAAGGNKGGRQWTRRSNIESDFDQDTGPDVRTAGKYKGGRQWQRPSDIESDFDQDTGPDVQATGEYKGGRQWQRQSDIESNFDQNTGPDVQATGEYKGGRQWQRQLDIESDFDRDTGPDVQPTGESEMRPASPSYPPEAYQNYRNLPMLNSMKPDDEQFQKLLDVVETLLTEGQEGLEGRIEVGVAERMLYEAADICAKALTIRPSSLQAIGLWGNTLLLHGELKLRLSQNLRSMVPEPLSQAVRRRNSWEKEQEQEGLEQTLQEVCEECEELLVEAGRKFRLALSLDRTDMRALYNWGLALCHRAQLISEEGGERSAQDADRVYLAAIDKFEALMGMSQKYAPGVLLNWGLAMRDRSRLRPLGSKERMKLLAQAKGVFKEALQFDPNYSPARGAVVACTIELKELEEFVDEPIEPPARERPSRQQRRGWLDRQDIESESQPRNWWD